MKKYFEKYETLADYQEAGNIYPHVSYVVATNEVIYEIETHDYSQDYFTIVALTDGTIEYTDSENPLSSSTDGGDTWVTGSQIYNVSVGDKVLWKGLNSPYPQCWNDSTAEFSIEGNIMSLMYGDNFQNQTVLTSSFHPLFYENEKLVSAENLVLPATTLVMAAYSGLFGRCPYLAKAPKELPATTLTYGCYNSMFDGCFSLTTAPELPATTLAEMCYNTMFKGCTSLTEAPQLPATTLASDCYSNMFGNCTSLTVAPTLPATTLAESCYSEMFNGCTSLSAITCLATDISAEHCTYGWVQGVSASGTFTKATNMTDWSSGVNGIPQNWTVVNL